MVERVVSIFQIIKTNSNFKHTPKRLSILNQLVFDIKHAIKIPFAHGIIQLTRSSDVLLLKG